MSRSRFVMVAALTGALHACVGGGDADDADNDRARESTVTQAVNAECALPTVMGVDIYSGTGLPVWADLKGSGYDFAFIKATQGSYDQQSTFGSDWAGAAAAGVQRSAYHFFDGTDDGVAQANNFLTELAAAGGMTDDDLPPLLDLECPVAPTQAGATADGSGCEYPGDSGWVANATLKQRTYDYLDTIEAALHRKPIIYSYPSWFADLDFADARLADYPLFIASYGSCASIPLPAPWTSATFWQYSATATVKGITGDVDVDRYFGSAGDLATWNAGTIERDAGVDAAADASTDAPADAGGGHAGSGCDCATGGGDALPPLALGVIVLLLGLRRRR